MLKTAIGASKKGNAADVYLEKIKPSNKENSARALINLLFCKIEFVVIFKLYSLLLFFLFHIVHPKIDITIKKICSADSKNKCV